MQRRAASAWWEEQMSGVHTTEADFRKELRLPRGVFETVLEAIKGHPVFSVPVLRGRSPQRGVLLAAFFSSALG